MATHSSILAWRIPGTAEPGGLLSMGSHRVGHNWSDLALWCWKGAEKQALTHVNWYHFFGSVTQHIWNLWPPDSVSRNLSNRIYKDKQRWDGWMASPTWWTWVWARSGSWWWTGKPGVLQSMGWQRVQHDWATELKQRCLHCSNISSNVKQCKCLWVKD